jgi:hypothetical protein
VVIYVMLQTCSHLKLVISTEDIALPEVSQNLH